MGVLEFRYGWGKSQGGVRAGDCGGWGGGCGAPGEAVCEEGGLVVECLQLH